jgi:hypothetical protein
VDQYQNALAAAKQEYYYSKARVDFITAIVQTTRKAAKAAQEALDAATLKGTLTSRDMADLDNEIQAIRAYTNALGEPDTAKIYISEANYENTLHYTQESLYNSLGENATDEEKREYFRALNVYTYVSESLGPTSPAKEMAKQAEIDA